MATPRTVRRVSTFAALMLSVMLATCTAPAPQSGDTAAAPPAVQAPTTPAPAPAAGQPATQPVKKPPPMSKPLPPERVGQPVVVDRSCKTDADCAVKDVGNCCGYFPACVNKNSPTNPAAVKAECAASGMASVCGFAEISACTCNAGQCEAADSPGAPVAQ